MHIKGKSPMRIINPNCTTVLIDDSHQCSPWEVHTTVGVALFSCHQPHTTIGADCTGSFTLFIIWVYPYMEFSRLEVIIFPYSCLKLQNETSPVTPRRGLGHV